MTTQNSFLSLTDTVNYFHLPSVYPKWPKQFQSYHFHSESNITAGKPHIYI